MSDDWAVVAGRLTAMEFVLEVMTARTLATASPVEAKAFADAMLVIADKWGLPPGSGPVDVDVMAPQLEAMHAALARFLERTLERAAQIRAAG